jgi:predicted phosphodiesterase
MDIPMCCVQKRKKIINPGSVSIPKEGNIPTYAILEDGVFSIRGFEGEIVKELELS